MQENRKFSSVQLNQQFKIKEKYFHIEDEQDMNICENEVNVSSHSSFELDLYKIDSVKFT